MVEVTEKGAQRPAHGRACCRAPILGVALNVADHVLLADLAQGDATTAVGSALSSSLLSCLGTGAIFRRFESRDGSIEILQNQL